MICPPDHKHDETLTCYKSHHCRCEPCTKNHSQRRKAWNRRSTRVPADFARAHIARAVDAGASMRAIADRVGLPQSTVWHVYKGNRERIDRAVHDKIMSFAGIPRNTAAAYRVERRLKALAALGYSMAAIEAATGVSATALQRIVAGERAEVRAVVAIPVFAFYREHEARPAVGSTIGVSKTLNWARREKFAPPAAWDNIDDPLDRPKGVAL